MRTRFQVLCIAAVVAASACRSTGGAPAPPGPSNPGTGVASPNPNIVPPTTPPPAPSPTVVPSASREAAPPPAAALPAQPPDAAAGPASERPYREVLKLKQAGRSEEFILDRVRAENVNYSMNTAQILELRSAGVSGAVIEAMLRSGRRPAPVPPGAPASRAEFSGLARVGKVLGAGTSTKSLGRLVVDEATISWKGSADDNQNFSVSARNIREIFTTCVERPSQNLCLEVGFVTDGGDEYKFRDPGWKNGENRLVADVTNYLRRAFPALSFSARAVNEL